jgi:sugar lactone lactonase YvrE
MTPQTVLDGLAFPEGPRWHDGVLYFSDQHDGIIWRVTPQGRATEVARVPARPSGLGWRPDGTLCAVSMLDRKLLGIGAGGTKVLAELSSLISYPANDMVIDRLGRAYIGNFGFDLDNNQSPRATVVLSVDVNGGVKIAADELMFPNGMVITPDGRTLIVAETFAARLTAFNVADDGSLSNRRVWADLNGVWPDGICLDEDTGVWVACPMGEEIIRVKSGGEVTDRIPLPGRNSFACALGGDDRRDLYICTAHGFDPKRTVKERAGKIEMVRVKARGAGLP